MKRLINALTVVVYLLSLAAISTGGVQAAEAASKVKHKPAKYFVPEHRIIVNAEVSDPNGVKLVRCYFKASAQADYVFVGMLPSSDGNYQGILPAPDKNTQSIEYLFLVLNNKKQVVKTQKFTVAEKDSKDVPSWQNVGSEGNIQVSTEIPTTSETLTGFKDSIAIDLVESSARLGLVAGGIYAVHAASAGGAAAATSAGTVTASTGMSTTTIAGIGAGVAAIGAVAALSGGGGGSDGGCPSSCPCGCESDGKTCKSCFDCSSCKCGCEDGKCKECEDPCNKNPIPEGCPGYIAPLKCNIPNGEVKYDDQVLNEATSPVLDLGNSSGSFIFKYTTTCPAAFKILWEDGSASTNLGYLDEGGEIKVDIPKTSGSSTKIRINVKSDSMSMACMTCIGGACYQTHNMIHVTIKCP